MNEKEVDLFNLFVGVRMAAAKFRKSVEESACLSCGSPMTVLPVCLTKYDFGGVSEFE